MPTGVLTYQVANRINEMLSTGEMDSRTLRFYYDPHLGNTHLDGPAKAAHIYPFMGNKASHASTLSQCDLMIAAATYPRQAKLLIEIEEGERGTVPKTVLGDVLNVWIADKVRADGKTFDLVDAVFWVVVCQPNKGSKEEKYDNLELRLQEIRDSVQMILHNRVKIVTTELVRCSQRQLVDSVIGRMKSDFPAWFPET